MNTSQFRLSDLGKGLCDAVIIQWYVAPGDYVVAGQLLAAIESSTTLVDIPASCSGRIASLEVAEGERIAAGALLLTFAASPGDSDAPADAASDGASPTGTDDIAAVHGTTTAQLRASPAARHLVRQLRHELESITTGDPDGTIATVDARHTAAIHGRKTSAWQELDHARRTMATHMAGAREAALASLHTRACIGAWHGQSQPLLRLIRAMVHACGIEPALNCWFDPSRPARYQHETVDIGLVLDMPYGACVPVLHDAAALDDSALSAIVREPHTNIPESHAEPQQAGEASISLADFSVFGIGAAQLIVPPPQVAIVSAGRSAEAVIARAGVAVVEPVLPLSLSFDQRAVSTREAARFLEALREHLEHPATV